MVAYSSSTSATDAYVAENPVCFLLEEFMGIPYVRAYNNGIVATISLEKVPNKLWIKMGKQLLKLIQGSKPREKRVVVPDDEEI